MLTKKQSKLIDRLNAPVPRSKASYPCDVEKLKRSDVQYLTYLSSQNNIRTLPVKNEDMDYIVSNTQRRVFYAFTSPCGEKIILMYDKDDNLAKRMGRNNGEILLKEIQISCPCRLRDDTFYYAKKIFSENGSEEQSNDYKLLWDDLKLD